MTSRPRIIPSRSRAFDALIGTGFAVLVIGVAVFGDITYHPSHRTALASMAGTRSPAVTSMHCHDKAKSGCVSAVCAGKPLCPR